MLDLDWYGYYFWANFGFLNREREEFEKWAISRKREEKTLNELMTSEDGRRLWKAEGFTWIGEFLLDRNSESQKYLNAYLLRCGIK